MGYADIGHAHIGYARIRCGRMGRVCLHAAGAFALFGFAMLAPSASAARDTVHLSGYSAGTIVVKTSQRRLYYFVDGDTASQYPGRRRQSRDGLVGNGLHQRQVPEAGVVAACDNQA